MANTQFLISDKTQQRVRVAEKREKILSWLAQEGHSNCEILSQVIGLQGHGAHACLKALERDQLIRFERLPTGSKMQNVYGLTPNGAGLMSDFENGQIVNYFESSKASPWALQHTLQLQKLRLRLEAEGWTQWRSDRQLRRDGQVGKWLKVPDAMAKSPAGEQIAIELERSMKSLKRYPEIMNAYLQMTKAGQIVNVNYWCVAPVTAKKMKQVFQSIKQIKINGQVVPLQDHHHQIFQFFDTKEQ